MSQQPVEANVTLTADTSDYNSNINQSAANTDSFGKSIDSLTGKIDRLVKTAGRKMVGFAAADLTGITAATAAYAAWERQMTSLSAQAAVLNRTMDGQKSTFNGYAETVNSLRGTFGVTTRDAAALTQTLTKMSDGTAPVLKLADSFMKLGNTTGESAQSLSQSMLMLQKTMGTPQRDTEKYNNQLAVLSANSSASASSILQFAQQLAPVGRLVNTSQTDIMGLSTAFNKAGQDGYQAANVYTKMVTDVAYATQSGSPDLKLYSNLVGMTVGQFKQLSSMDQVTRVFDSINRQGPAAITTLNRMGLDGMRTVRTVTAMAQQSGGLQEALDQARNADPNALDRGNKAATGGLIDGLSKLRSELAMTGEAFGSNFAGPAGGFITLLDKMGHVANTLVGGDLGKIAGLAAGIGVAFAGVAGSIALATKGAFAFAGLNQLFRNSFTYGVREANAPSSAFARSMGVAGAPGRVGRAIEANGNFVNRALYSAGSGLGARGYNPRNWAMQATGMGLRGGAWVSRELVRPMLSPGTLGGLENINNRWRLFNEPSMMNYRPVSWLAGKGWQSAGVQTAATEAGQVPASLWGRAASQTAAGVSNLAGRVAGPMFRNAGVLASTAIMAGGMTKMAPPKVAVPPPVAPSPFGQTTPAGPPIVTGPKIKQPGFNHAGGVGQTATTPTKPPPTPQQDRLNVASGQAWMAKQQEAALRAARALGQVEKESTGLASGLRVAAREMILMGGTISSVGAGIGKTLYQLVGNNPYIATAAGAFAGFELLKAGSTQIGKVSSPTSVSGLSPYLAAGGIQPSAAFSPLRLAQGENQTVLSAQNISPQDSAAANDASYKYTNTGLKHKTQAEALAMLGPQFAQGKNSPAVLSAVALDLTAEFGRSNAQKMMNKLQAGGGQNSNPLLLKAVNEPAAGSWWHKIVSGDPNYSNVSKDYSQYFKANQDQIDYRASQAGPNAQKSADQLRYEKFGKALLDESNVGGQNPLPNYNRKEGYARPASNPKQGADPNKLNREAFIKNLAHSQGVEMSPEESGKFRIPANVKNATEAAKAFFDQVFSKDTSDKIQNAWLSSFGQNKGLTGHAARDAVLNEMSGKNIGVPDLSLDQKIGYMEGGDVFTSKIGRTALSKSANVNDQYTAADKIVSNMTAAGKSTADIIQAMGSIKATAGTDKAPEYLLAQQAQAQAQRKESWTLPGMSPTARFGANIKDFTAAFQGAVGDPNQKQEQAAAEDTMQQQAEGMRQYFVGLLTQQREFNISKKRSEDDFQLQRDRMDYQYNLQRTRAQSDFHLQQKWQQEDFNLQRTREEYDFHLQRARATADYNRQMQRSQYDFNLQRKRQEQDYQHSVVQMVKQAALESADIYKRTQVQSTTSGSWLVFNASEQLKQMKDQEKNLKELRGMGMSTNTIQQLKLTDPNNAQQLERLVGDAHNDPKLIKQLNEAIAKRLKAAGAVATDQSSDTWREFNRQYRLSRDRGTEDFHRQVDLSHQDFKRNMDNQETDFQRMLKNQGTDYQTAADRQQTQFHTQMKRAATDYQTTTNQMVKDFNTSMTRAANDLDRSSKTIDGNLAQVLNKATKSLSGHAAKQAATVKAEFAGVDDTTTGISTALMKSLAAIFGVEWHAPKLHHNQTNQSSNQHAASADLRGTAAATGGVLPGFTPGKDVHHFYSPTAGNLHLSGGEAIMRPEWTKAVGGEKAVAQMNAAAMKGQKFAGGGVWRPVATGSYGQEQDEGGFRAVDVGVTNGTPVHAARAGRVSISKDLVGPDPKGRMARGGYHSYGRYITIAHDTGNTIYAHLSRRLAGQGEEVRGGELIGYSGHTGYTLGRTGDHLHFGANGSPTVYDFMGGSRDYIGQGVAKGAFGDGSGGGSGSAGFALDSILKSAYAKVEKAMNMSAIHPLKYGQMSGIINKMATKAYMKFVAKYGDPSSVAVGGAPTNVTGNKAIVRDMAAAKGWTGIEWDALYKVMMDESGFRNTAQNPTSTAYGMFQFLDKTWAAYGGHKTSDARLQTKYGLNYIAKRYGDPLGALRHENQHGWYGDGQIFSGPRTIGVGERGPEMLLPLNDRGASFIQNLMEKMMPGNAAKSQHTAGFAQPTTVHNMHNYQIDKSTTFSGPITVQANDPNMLINQLKIRARTQALTNAAKGGVKVA